MTTRAGTGRSYIKVDHIGHSGRSLSPLLVTVVVIVCLALVPVFFFLTSAHEEAREEFVEKLNRQKQVVEINKNLKMELVAITQRGYVEFAAQERLGLKRPKQEEVVVLR